MAVSGQVSLTSGELNIAGQLNITGEMVLTNAYLDFVTPTAVLRILNGGEFSANSGGYSLRDQSGGTSLGMVVEAGGLLENEGGLLYVGAPLTVNGGAVTVSGGHLLIQNSATLNNPSINVSAGALFDLASSGATMTLNGTATGTGAGIVRHDDGTFEGGTNAVLNFAPGQLQVSGGGSMTGAFTIPVSSDLSVVNSELNLAGQITVSGQFKQFNAYVDFTSASATIRIVSGGLYDANTAGYSVRDQSGSTAAGIIVEAGGTLQNTAQTLYIDVPVTVNGGAVSVLVGNLFTRTTATLNSPTIHVGSGGIFDITSGTSTATLNGTATGTGLGAVRHDDGTFAGGNNAVLNFAPGQFQVSGGGSMTGAFNIAASSDLSVVSGELNLAGQLTVSGQFKQFNAYVDFTSTTAAIRILSGGRYEANTGGYTVRDQSGSAAAGLAIESGGMFVATGGAIFIAVPIVNQGTIHAQGGNIGITSGVSGIQNRTLSGGKWIIDASRNMSVSGPAITTNAADVEISGTFTGFAPTSNTGTLAYRTGADFTSAARFTNSGTLSLGPGSVMTVAGFTQTGAGRVEFQVDGFTQANTGRIVSSQGVVLAGTADITTVPPFAPQGGTNYVLMQYPSKTGDFSSVTGLFLGHEKVFESFTEATQFRLNTTIDAGDLSITSVTSPTSGIAGQNVSISYTAQNVGVFAIPTNTWFDAIYLSADATLDASDLLVQRLEITGTLAQNATYSRNITAQLPGALPGSFHVFVVADSRGLARPRRARQQHKGRLEHHLPHFAHRHHDCHGLGV